MHDRDDSLSIELDPDVTGFVHRVDVEVEANAQTSFSDRFTENSNFSFIFPDDAQSIVNLQYPERSISA